MSAMRVERSVLGAGLRRSAGGAALLVALCLAAGCGKGDDPSTTKAETPAKVPGAATNGHAQGGTQEPKHAPLPLLVSVEELQKLQKEPWLRIVDVRSAEEYVAGHVPQAVWVETDAWKDAALEPQGLENARVWSELVGGSGIGQHTGVVVYADDPTRAARVWWTLKYVGVTDVAILDGGWKAWQAAGGESSQEETAIAPAPFAPRFQTARLARMSDVRKAVEEQGTVVLDARSADEYAGKTESEGRKGHLPKAVHLEWKEFVAEDGRFKSRDDVRKLFEERGATSDKKVIVHCQSGGRAAVEVFLLEWIGRPPVANYYCGWHEWSGDATAPIETP